MTFTYDPYHGATLKKHRNYCRWGKLQTHKTYPKSILIVSWYNYSTFHPIFYISQNIENNSPIFLKLQIKHHWINTKLRLKFIILDSRCELEQVFLKPRVGAEEEEMIGRHFLVAKNMPVKVKKGADILFRRSK